MTSRQSSRARWLALAPLLALASCGGSASEARSPARSTFESRVPTEPSRAPSETPAATPEGAGGGWLSGAELCGELTRNATVRVEPIYGGAMVRILPSSFAERDRIRTAVWEFERRVEHLPGQQPELKPGALSERCGMNALRDLGATMLVTETGDAVQLLITSDDPDRSTEVLAAARRLSLGATSESPEK